MTLAALISAAPVLFFFSIQEQELGRVCDCSQLILEVAYSIDRICHADEIDIEPSKSALNEIDLQQRSESTPIAE